MGGPDAFGETQCGTWAGGRYENRGFAASTARRPAPCPHLAGTRKRSPYEGPQDWVLGNREGRPPAGEYPTPAIIASRAACRVGQGWLAHVPTFLFDSAKECPCRSQSTARTAPTLHHSEHHQHLYSGCAEGEARREPTGRSQPASRAESEICVRDCYSVNGTQRVLIAIGLPMRQTR